MVVAGLEPSNIVKLTIIVILFAKEASEMGGNRSQTNHF